MDFNDQIRRYFATDDLASLSPAALESGIEKMKVDFGLEEDSSRRFALWTLLYMLGDAPDLDAFEDEADREAARNFMDLIDKAT